MNFSPCIDIALISLYFLVLQENWVLAESRILLKPEESLHIPLVLMNRLN